MSKRANDIVLSPGLTISEFTKIADNGFGDALNSYAHTMVWFQEHLYVGTTRANLCMVKVNSPPSLRFWPTKCPDDVYDLDLRAQIWRYNPRTENWQQVFISPLVVGTDGQEVPRDLGYRGMTVFQGIHDPTPALYVSTWASARSGKAPLIMRSSDGSKFVTVSELRNDRAINSYRVLLPYNGHLYTSPTGRVRGKSNLSDSPIVFEKLDPTFGDWRPVSAPGFGDSTNLTVFEMVSFNGFLYAGTLNPMHGFQIWKTRATGEPPYKWTKVIMDGAYGGNLNEIALSMCVFNNALYVGTGIQNGGYDRTYKIGPAATEIIRIHPDDSWDLIVGEPRRTPQGFKHPLSGFGPGFDDVFNAYIWRMCVHDGCLYAGTYNWSVFLPYLSLSRWPTWSRTLVKRIGIDNIVQRHGGFDLWRSRDGESWVPVHCNGFSNPYNYGARTLESTPFGLFVGTANPFGPEMAVETMKGWRYVPNPKGGLEIWLGTSRQRVEEDRKMTIDDRRLTHRGAELLEYRELAQPTTSINRLYDNRMYDELMDEYYDWSDFCNFGYWHNNTHNQREACENLMEELLSFIPEKSGTILDVACGKGATTRYLLKYYMPLNVTGINISEKQLETCRKNAPGCTFLLMDATKLNFQNASFDNIICVESAFHFNTREKFLHEAWRVLKPRGRLVLSDILFMNKEMTAWSPYMPAENYVRNLEEYKSLYLRAGFKDIEIINATYECLRQFCRHCYRYMRRQSLTMEFDRQEIIRPLISIASCFLAVRRYMLVSARKPD